MDLSVFQAWLDPQHQAQAREVILQQYQNPTFLPSVLAALGQEIPLPGVPKVLALVQKDIIQKIWGAIESVEYKNQIVPTLIQLLFSVNVELKPHIGASISLIMQNERNDYRASIVDLVTRAFTENPNVLMWRFILDIYVQWASYMNAGFDEFLGPFLEMFKAYVPSVTAFDDGVCEIFDLAAQVMTKTFSHADAALATESCLVFCTAMMNALDVPVVTEKSVAMKASIWKLFTNINKSLGTVPGSQPGQAAFFQPYTSTIFAQLFPKIVSNWGMLGGVRNGPIDEMLTALLGFVRQLIVKMKNSAKKEETAPIAGFLSQHLPAILTPSFITDILIPCSRLTEENLNNEFMNIPEQFVQFCLSSFYDICEEELMIRHVCGDMVFHMRDMIDLPALLVQCMGTPLDMEASMFLLAKCHERVPMNEALYGNLVAKLGEVWANPQLMFIAPSILMALRNSAMEPNTIRDVAYAVFIGSPHPVIQLDACALLNEAMKHKMCVDLGSVHPQQFLECALGLIKKVKHENLGIAIGAIVSKFKDAFIPYTHVLIQSLLQGWLEIMQNLAQESEEQDEEMDEEMEIAGEELLDAASEFLREQAPEVLAPSIEAVLEFICQALTQFGDSESTPNLLKLASMCCMKSPALCPGHIALLSIVCQLLTATEMGGYLLPECSTIFCPLFKLGLPPEVLTSVVQTIVGITTSRVEEDISGTGLAILSYLIQLTGDVTFAQLANTVMTLEDVSLFEVLGCVFIYASALHVTQCAFAEHINPAVAAHLVGYIAEESEYEWTNLKTPRTSKVILIFLSYLISLGHGDFVPPAIAISQMIINETGREEEEDFEMYGDMDDDMLEAVVLLRADIEMPLDEVNEFALFVEALQKIGAYDGLPGEFKAACQSMIK